MSDAPSAASLFPPDLLGRATALVAALTAQQVMVATAESCTGGLLAALLTEIAGSSAVVDRGFVTYSNEGKADLLGVPWDLLEAKGAVSTETAVAMAEGARSRSRAAYAVSITGIAGPGGGTAEKPVGLVHFALASRHAAPLHVERRFGAIGRASIRLASLDQALSLLESAAFGRDDQARG